MRLERLHHLARVGELLRTEVGFFALPPKAGELIEDELAELELDVGELAADLSAGYGSGGWEACQRLGEIVRAMRGAR